VTFFSETAYHSTDRTAHHTDCRAITRRTYKPNRAALKASPAGETETRK